jgi:hypothetical protein
MSGGPARLILHIGMPKTGTSFLQHNLSANRAALAGVGVIYPDPVVGLGTPPVPAHHFLAHALAQRRQLHTPDADFGRLPGHAAALAALMAVPGATAILSSEDFTDLRRHQIRRLKALFPGLAVSVLVYLRRQDQWVEAMYGQTLKVGRHLHTGTFIERNRRLLDYAAILAPWAEVFGADSLIVRPYEGFEAGGLWPDFCNAIGCPQAAAIAPIEAQVNVSLSREAASFLARVPDPVWRYRLRLLLERAEPRRPARPGLTYLSARQAAALMAAHRAGNDRIAALHLGRPHLFHDDRPLPQAPRPSRLRRRARVLWRLLAGLVLSGADAMRRRIARRA